MRKFYQEYFQIPKIGEGIVRDKVFWARIIASIACIVLCMFAMAYNAYAYFSSSVLSDKNTIQTAGYSFVWETDSIKVVSTNGSVANEGAVGKYRLQPGTYDFTLKKQGQATTGYGEIEVFDQQGNVVDTLYTKQIGVVDADGSKVESRIVRIQTTKEVTIQVTACWGTYINPEANPAFDEVAKMIVIDGNDVSLKEWAVPTEPVAEEQEEKQEEKPEEQKGSVEEGEEILETALENSADNVNTTQEVEDINLQ